MEISDIRSIEDFVEFKYKNKPAYEAYRAKPTNFQAIPIFIDIDGALVEVFIQDVEVEERVISSKMKFKMIAILGLNHNRDEDENYLDYIQVSNTCIAPSGCMHIDWTKVNCVWKLYN